MNHQATGQTNLISTETGASTAGFLLKWLLGILILAAGLGTGAYFIFSGSGTERNKAGEQEIQAVSVTRVETSSPRPRFKALGTVKPARSVVLSPRVNGQITSVSESFIPGGRFEKGDTILTINRRDYQLAVKQKENALRKARANLQLEEGEQAVAREELERFDEEVADTSRELVLRGPQLSRAQADLNGARLELEQARLNLDRSVIKAPFSAHVIERYVEHGSNVSPGQKLAQIAGVNEYWVEVTVPVSNLRWLKIPDAHTDTGSRARLYAAGSDTGPFLREGRIKKLIGRVDETSRQARLLVGIEDPLGLESKGLDELLLGSYVQVEFVGQEMPEVVRLNRDLLRRNDRVYVLNEENRLEKRKINIAFSNQSEVFVDSGLAAGDQVIVSELSQPVAGTRLRLREETSSNE